MMFKKRGTISCSLTIVRKCFVLGLGHCVFGSNRFVSNSLHSIFAGRWLFSLLPFVRLLLIILVFFLLTAYFGFIFIIISYFSLCSIAIAMASAKCVSFVGLFMSNCSCNPHKYNNITMVYHR